jgi:hypothetical protein
MKEAKHEIYFDNRISQRSIRDGRIEREEFEQYLASLPDLESACEDISEEIFGSKISGVAVTGEYIKSEHDDEA